MLLLLVIITSSIFSTKLLAINVTYISQTQSITPYWYNVYAVANAAAKDLGINLTIVKGQGHRIFQAKVIEKIVLASKKPDLLIFHAYKQNAHEYFTTLEQAKIPFVTYSNFTNTDNLPPHKQLGRPLGKYKYWLSEHYVENAQGAALLVKNLIKQAVILKKPSNKKLKILALSGDLILESLERSIGVAAQVEETDNAILVQDIIANWSAEDAKIKFKTLYARHKGIDIVWASSDVMAMGALDGAIELGLQPNKDIFIGGFDWDAEAIAKIKGQQLSASAGGQFYNIAWLLVQVYDHLNNKAPFTTQSQRINDKYTVIEQSNLVLLEPLTNINILSNVNFYCFTKTFTRQHGYNFSMSNLLKQSKTPNKRNCH
jgi:ABC-type sugar transport system substrate-binding protein